MSSSLFCCDGIKPFRPQYLNHESKFNTFTKWATYPKSASAGKDAVDLSALGAAYVVQLVRQVNYGPLESKRYFAVVEGQEEQYVEVVENDLIQANFQKLNS